MKRRANLSGAVVGVIARNPEALGVTKQSPQQIIKGIYPFNIGARRLLRPRLSFLQTRPRNDGNKKTSTHEIAIKMLTPNGTTIKADSMWPLKKRH